MHNWNIFQYFTKKTDDQSSSNPNGPCNAPSSSVLPSKIKKSKPLNECTIEPSESKASYYEHNPGQQIPISHPLEKQWIILNMHVKLMKLSFLSFCFSPIGEAHGWEKFLNPPR